MIAGQRDRFHRLLEILHPVGGTLVLMHEAYFDESGDFEEEPGVFCIAGYYVASDAAAEMDKKWAEVLDRYKVPYFHMVDCAHGNAPFDKMSKGERIEIVKDLIQLIKIYTIEVFAVLGKKENYIPKSDEDDKYSNFVEMSVGAIDSFMDINRIKDPISYFFETGHHRKGRAYSRVAEKIESMSASITFGKKAVIRLLQAGDLLAWQCAKYAKDKVTGARPPRKDFLSLMEHRHMLAFVNRNEDNNFTAFEAFPFSRRSPETVEINTNESLYIMSFSELGDPTPIIPVKGASGHRLGGGRMAYVKFRDFKEKDFALAFDEMRIFESIAMLIQATELYGYSNVRFRIKSMSVQKAEESVMLTVNFEPQGRLSFDISQDAAQELIDVLREMIGGGSDEC